MVAPLIPVPPNRSLFLHVLIPNWLDKNLLSRGYYRDISETVTWVGDRLKSLHVRSEVGTQASDRHILLR